MKWTVALVGLALLVGGVLGWLANPAPEVRYREKVVTKRAMVAFEPEIDLSGLGGLIERLHRAELEAERARAPGGGREEVLAFCGPVIERVGQLDTVPRLDLPAPDARLLLHAGRITRGWAPFSADRLELFGVTNRLDRTHDTYYGSGTVEWMVRGDSTVATGDQWWLAALKEATRCLPWTAGGYVTGRARIP